MPRRSSSGSREAEDVEGPELPPAPSQRPDRKRARSASPPPRDPPSFEEEIEDIERRKGRAVLTLREKLLIVRLDAVLRERERKLKLGEQLGQQQAGAGAPPLKRARKFKTATAKYGRLYAEIANLTGFNHKTVRQTLGPYRKAINEGKNVAEALDTVGVAAARGNFKAKKKRITPTRAVARKIRIFVRERRARDEQVNATHVTAYLAEQGDLGIKKSADGSLDPKSLASAQRIVRYLLVRLGYQRGRRKDGQVEEKPHHIEIWKNYLETVAENRAAPLEKRLCEVYLDESYCHNYHHNHKNSVWDPKDKEDKQKQEKHKGRRYCFAAAIRGPIPQQRGSKAAYLHDTLWMFEPRNVKVNTDYHKTFNGTNFAKWWTTQLLPNIPKLSLVIMDGASYHVGKDPDMPDVAKMRKDELLQRLKEEHNIDYPNPKKVYVKDLKKTLSVFYAAKFATHLERLTREFSEKNGASISIVLTPPYLSDLQPIERLWAWVKNWVAAQYDNTTTLDDVRRRLIMRFEAISRDQGQFRQDGKTLVQAFIDTADKHFATEWAELLRREGRGPEAAAEQFAGVEELPEEAKDDDEAVSEWDSDKVDTDTDESDSLGDDSTDESDDFSFGSGSDGDDGDYGSDEDNGEDDDDE